MDKKTLYDLLGKYLNGTGTQRERDLIDHWLELLQEDKAFASYTQDDLEAISSRMWQKIQAQTYGNTEVKEEGRRPFKMGWLHWAIAASVAGLLLFAGFRYTQTREATKPPGYASIVPQQGMIAKTNTDTKPLTLRLEDSSVVVLEPGTTLNYPERFLPAKREVYLEGKAFFDVSKNARRPFYIYHNNLVTHVLGTSFIIDTKRAKEEVEVSVITGRVEVSEASDFAKLQANKKVNGVILTPNQKVTYAVNSRSFIPALVDKPVPVKKAEAENFDFDDVTLSRVLSAISSEYAIEIVTENESINKCTFSGNLANDDLYGKLDVLCKATNSSYEIKGTQVLIKGAGCE